LSHIILIVWGLLFFSFSQGAKIKVFTCFAVFLLSSKRQSPRFIFINAKDEE
jgi:hypothetical protein